MGRGANAAKVDDAGGHPRGVIAPRKFIPQEAGGRRQTAAQTAATGPRITTAHIHSTLRQPLGPHQQEEIPTGIGSLYLNGSGRSCCGDKAHTVAERQLPVKLTDLLTQAEWDAFITKLDRAFDEEECPTLLAALCCLPTLMVWLSAQSQQEILADALGIPLDNATPSVRDAQEHPKANASTYTPGSNKVQNDQNQQKHRGNAGHTQVQQPGGAYGSQRH